MAIENELPPHFTGDAAHALEQARLTVKAMQRQVEECEAHNSDLADDLVKLRAQLAAVRAFCQAEQKYARTAVMQGDNPAHWTTRSEQAQKVLDILKAGL